MVNLVEALWAIRDPIEPKLVWANSICINQNDDMEKGQQVKRMGRVYQNAKGVLIWLNKDTEAIAEDCFNLIQQTNKYLDTQLEIYGSWSKVPKIAVPCPISSDKLRWRKVNKLMKLPWFNRLWVIQEAGLAKSCVLLWGEHRMSMAELCELSLWLRSRADLCNITGQHEAQKLADTFTEGHCTYDNEISWRESLPFLKSQKGRAESAGRSFLSVLHMGRGVQASYAVDRVYAFLGNPLARKAGSVKDGEELIVEPDYSRTVNEVYFETARGLLANPRDAGYVLAAVDHCHLRCVEGGDLPSWVPRWDMGWRLYPMSLPRFWYRAGGLDRKFEAYVQGDKSLLLPGVIFDSVSWTSNSIDERNFSLDSDKWDYEVRAAQKPFIDLLWKEVLDALSGLSGHRKKKMEEWEDAFSLTLVRGYPAKISSLQIRKHRADFDTYRLAVRRKASPALDKNLINLTTQRSKADLHSFSARILYGNGRRFACTNSGYFGLVPFFAQPGDVWCIFPGMKVPLILRRREDGRYYLVGDSYIHGVMQGEVMEQLKEDKLKAEDILLV